MRRPALAEFRGACPQHREQSWRLSLWHFENNHLFGIAFVVRDSKEVPVFPAPRHADGDGWQNPQVMRNSLV
jgi:hypothetical protein